VVEALRDAPRAGAGAPDSLVFSQPGDERASVAFYRVQGIFQRLDVGVSVGLHHSIRYQTLKKSRRSTETSSTATICSWFWRRCAGTCQAQVQTRFELCREDARPGSLDSGAVAFHRRPAGTPLHRLDDWIQ
jgi:hypothetical protein